MIRPPPKLLALELSDRYLPCLQLAAVAFRTQLPSDGWVRWIRKSLGMSMEVLAGRMHFKQSASVKDLERNERLGTITLQTLKRAAEALDADFVYAIVPRKPLRETVASRARELAVQRLVPSLRTKAPEHQVLSDKQIDRVDGLARTLERKPHLLWR